jgi:hypothetical protein
VRSYCVLGPLEQCIPRLPEYVDAGAGYIIFSVDCPKRDRATHIETIGQGIMSHFRHRAEVE